MNRNAAGMAVKRCAYLTAAERLVFLALLEVADNPDCNLQAKYTPTVPSLAGWTHLGRTTVKRALNHLASHGWLDIEPGRGRGHKSNYRLVPGSPDLVCHCQKGPQRTPLGIAKGSTETPKRVQIEQEKGPTGPEFQQVNPAFARRESREEGVVEPRCDLCSATPSRIDNAGARYCAGCAPHLWKETA